MFGIFDAENEMDLSAAYTEVQNIAFPWYELCAGEVHQGEQSDCWARDGGSLGWAVNPMEQVSLQKSQGLTTNGEKKCIHYHFWGNFYSGEIITLA